MNPPFPPGPPFPPKKECSYAHSVKDGSRLGLLLPYLWDGIFVLIFVFGMGRGALAGGGGGGAADLRAAHLRDAAANAQRLLATLSKACSGLGLSLFHSGLEYAASAKFVCGNPMLRGRIVASVVEAQALVERGIDNLSRVLTMSPGLSPR